MSRRSFLLTAFVLIGGCNQTTDEAPADPAPADAAVIDARAAPIMTDLDLVSLNEGNSAIAASGVVSSALPPIDRSQEAVDLAREAAARLVGRDLAPLPDAISEDLAPMRTADTAAQMAAAANVASADCASAARYTARWAALLPQPLEVYPRGAVQEAAGSDAAGCGLRVVHFRTPVAVADVTAFYLARLRAAGWPARHSADGDEQLLRGRSGGTAYVVYLRKAADGLTATDIIVGR